MPVKKKAAAPAKKSAVKAAAPARKATTSAAKAPAAAKKAAKKAAAPAAAGAAKKVSASKPKATAAKKPRPARKSAAKKTTTRRGASTTLGIPATSLPPAVLPPPAGQAPARGPRDMGVDTPGTALARAVADAADMKKAEHIAILDVRGLSMVTDFLVIVSASSMPHLRAIRNEISERIREDRQEKPHSAQGAAESHWMLLDYGDVVAHIFLEEKRALYALEDLWSDAPRLTWSPP